MVAMLQLQSEVFRGARGTHMLAGLMVSKGMRTILPDDLYHVVAFSVSPH